MNKAILIASCIFAFAGCGVTSKIGAKFTGSSTVCVDGVEYLQFTSGATVAYNTDGTIKTCP
jgi:hypothetical protein